MYDVVWYSPDRRDDAERVLRRLDLQEAIDRQIGDLRMSQPGIPIPGQSGIGRCVCRNFLGAECLPLGDPSITGALALTDHGPGLVGGYLTAEFLLSGELQEAQDAQAERERRALTPRAPKSHEFVALSIRAALTCLVCAFAAFWTLPRYLKRERKRRIRSLAELEVAASELLGAMKGGGIR